MKWIGNMELIEVKDIKSNNYIREQLNELIEKNIYIYGAGSFGKEMYYYMQGQGIKVKGFIDRNAKDKRVYCNEKVYLPYELQNRHAVTVLFTIVMDIEERKEIIHYLNELDYKDIREAQYYRSMQVVSDDEDSGDMYRYYCKHQDNIKLAYDKLEDIKSRKLYKVLLNAYFTRDYTQCDIYEERMSEQYFPKDITLSKGYTRFVDCGGYIGDTIQALVTNYGDEIDAVVVFEPDLDNYRKMVYTVGKLVKENYCYPCAVSNCVEFCTFDKACGSGTIMSQGTSNALTVSLDETIKGFNPTFIKMDIEGAEIKAIEGAKSIIKLNKPDLAICIYHNINHLWDVLLLLDSWELGYKFYIRSYNAYTMETVLYATVDKKGE